MLIEKPSSTEQNTVAFLQGNLPPRQEINAAWLTKYESRPDSIFKYYSIDNEARFLKKRKEIPIDEKVYYLEENVKRFIGEFVGKVPYTTIPYTLKSSGFDYAGMHVMDTYNEAKKLGGNRETAETDGFAKIEEKFTDRYNKRDNLPTAVWISPPKIADYGFVFVLSPQQNGKIKEYVLRYGERRDETNRSQEIANHIGPHLFFNVRSTEDFLNNPVFIDSSPLHQNTLLQGILKSVGVSQKKIDQSLRFEREVDLRLFSWIRAYTSVMINLSETPENTMAYIDQTEQAKAILLSIYSYAQRIRDEIQEGVYSSVSQLHTTTSLSLEHMGRAFVHAQQNDPLVEGGGSCPVVETTNNFPGDQQNFISNTDMANAIAKKTPLEKLAKDEKNKSFPCPQCHGPIPAGEGRTTCPHCGITKEKYAQMKGGQTCA